MNGLHRLAHWLGWNGGRVESWWHGDQVAHLLVGFRCAGCDELLAVVCRGPACVPPHLALIRYPDWPA